jgi:predicted acylesterase/phospholipase RssA
VALRSKRALVLSAGGMFGAYQAGVWDVLHRWFKPDLVVGASVGSLNGYLIACGVESRQLVERWRSLAALQAIRWRPSVHLTRGLVDVSTLEAWMQEMCRQTPRCEFAAVATETLTCRQRMFCSPEVTWIHLAASCGVPLFLPAHRIDGVLYSDGGLVEPLPLWAAIELGATEIVAINVLSHPPLAIRTAVRILRAYSGYRRPDMSGVSVVEISPSKPLGGARDSAIWNPEKARAWIDLGRIDAKAAANRVSSAARWPSGAAFL